MNTRKFFIVIVLGLASVYANANSFKLVPTGAFDADVYAPDAVAVTVGQIVQFDVLISISNPAGTYGGAFSIAHGPELVPVGWVEAPVGNKLFREGPVITIDSFMEAFTVADFTQMSGTVKMGTLNFVATREGEFNVGIYGSTLPVPWSSPWMDGANINLSIPVQTHTAVVLVNEN